MLVLAERKIRAVLTDPTGKPGSMLEIGYTDTFNLSSFVVGNFDGGGRFPERRNLSRLRFFV
jgi:hypothetical protein